LRDANLRSANLNGVKANIVKGCPILLPIRWSCKKNSLYQY